MATGLAWLRGTDAHPRSLFLRLYSQAPHRQSPQPLRHHLLNFSLLCALPLALTAVLLSANAVHDAEKLRRLQVQTQAQSAAAEIEGVLGRRIERLRALSARPAVEIDAAALNAWYSDAQSFDRKFGSPVFLANLDRRMLLHSREPLGHPLPSVPVATGRNALQEAVDTAQPAVSNVVDGPVLGTKVVALAVPMHGIRPELVWMNPIPVERFATALAALQLPERWSMTLLDGNGDLIARSANAPELHQIEPPHVTLPIALTPWRLQIHIPTLVLYAPVLQLAAILVLTLLGTLFSAVCLSRRYGAALNAALERLTSKVSRPDGDNGVPQLQVSEFEAARAELQRLDAAKHAAQEDERRRIALDLHDGMQQRLAALQIDLELSIQSNKANRSADATALAEKARDATKAAIDDLRSIVNDLRPRVLDELGLKAALEYISNQFMSDTNIDVELEVLGEDAAIENLPPRVSSALYRITQECLNNVRKHAHASFVYVLLDLSDPARLSLRVSDDGIGMQPSDQHPPQSHGLRGMAERVVALGGSLRIEAAAAPHKETGTTVVAEVPLSS